MIMPHATGHTIAQDGSVLRIDIMAGQWVATRYARNLAVTQRVEHFAGGDMFDSTLQPGWAPFTASGLAQWGPPVTQDFLGTSRDRFATRRSQ